MRKYIPLIKTTEIVKIIFLNKPIDIFFEASPNHRKEAYMQSGLSNVLAGDKAIKLRFLF